MSKWISVKDRLPTGDVNALWDGKVVCVGYCAAIQTVLIGLDGGVTLPTPRFVRSQDSADIWPTHWMQLPSPPDTKGVEE